MMGRTAKTVLRVSRQQVRPPRKVCPFCFESDHIAGRNHIPHLTVDVCQLHHAVTGHAIAWAVDKLCEGLEFCAEKLTALRQK